MIDVLIAVLLILSVAAEVRRGLFLALFDILRIGSALALAVVGYNLGEKLFHNYAAGIAGFLLFALAAVFLLPLLLKFTRLDPDWGRRLGARVAAGGVGLALGVLICTALVPVLGRLPGLRREVARAPLAQPFLELMPGIYTIADRLELSTPTFARRPTQFEEEGAAGAVFDARIKYSKLDGSTCIECRNAVHFLGYRRVRQTAVSPKFECPNCGRTSDGCQTYEGFHIMYGHCPHEVASGRIEIDCGVWPNGHTVKPLGTCPVCGRRR